MRRLREILARQQEIQAELAELEQAEDSDEGLTDEQAERSAELVQEFDRLQEEAGPLLERAEGMRRVREANVREEGIDFPVPNLNRNEDPFDLNTLRFGAPVSEVRGRAATAVERIESEVLDDDQRQELTRKVEGTRNGFGGRIWDPQGAIPRMVLLSANPHYHRAFQLFVSGRSMLWSNEEREAVRLYDELRTYLNIGTDAQGGFGVPVTLDPSLIMTSAGTVNPFRQIARVETIVNNQWRGLSSAGVTAGFRAEAAQAGDDSPTFAGPTVTAHMADAFVGASIEAVGDFVGLAADLQMMFSEAKDDLEAAKFVNGAGDSSNEPYGITTALDGTASEISPTTAEAFALADLYLIDGAVPPRARSAAARLAHVLNRGTVNLWRELAMAENSAEGVFVNPAAGQPGTLLGVPWYEASEMHDANDIDDTDDADNFVDVLGDWRNYVIVDRVGLTVEFIPHLLGADRRPTGQRGWYAYWRVGADSVNDAMFRMLSIPTSST